MDFDNALDEVGDRNDVEKRCGNGDDLGLEIPCKTGSDDARPILV